MTITDYHAATDTGTLLDAECAARLFTLPGRVDPESAVEVSPSPGGKGRGEGEPPALSSITKSRQAAIQRTISERNARFFEAQDKVDQQREDLIANIEGKLQQRASLIELFAVRWCLVDMNPVKVLVTGSSALRIEAGADSLAGRVFTVEMGPLLLREIADLRGFGKLSPLLPFNGPGPLKEKEKWRELRQFGIDNAAIRHQAFSAFSERGAYFLRTINGLDVAHFPARPTEPEVDFVLTIGEQRIPVEVKYRARIDHQDTVGLRAFMEKAHYNAPFGILVTRNEEVASDDPRIVSLPLSSLLLLR